jgi:hypothetical protein
LYLNGTSLKFLVFLVSFSLEFVLSLALALILSSVAPSLLRSLPTDFIDPAELSAKRERERAVGKPVLKILAECSRVVAIRFRDLLVGGQRLAQMEVQEGKGQGSFVI